MRGSTSTPQDTSTNANNVPMLVSWVISPLPTNSAGTATMMPVMMVENHGVLNFGWILPKALGNSLSRLMLIQMRGCPSWNTSSTLVVATTALTEIKYPIHFWFTLLNTKASGSVTFSSEKWTMPVSTSAISIYNTVQITSE